MTQDEQGLSNADQRRYWNENGGAIWVAKEDMYDEELAPLGRIAMDRANVGIEERVLDVGLRRLRRMSRLAASATIRPWLHWMSTWDSYATLAVATRPVASGFQ